MLEFISGLHIFVGILILIVGFIFHWIGQLISILDWDLATSLGLQEKDMPPEFKVYEHAIAVADVSIGWTYGIAAVGLVLGLPWAVKLVWIPGVILIYHSLSFWYWTGNRIKLGYHLETRRLRVAWSLLNFITGILAIIIAWQ
ncbi:hypothetical protein [Methanolobus sp. WCC4]|uniref:hypothetical protein n=1 Tax=Methanolobus sp. WCC4 TaxID=3125784 RepID=UPI0030F9F24C